MEDSCSRVLSVELTEVFREGIGLIFKLWPVLQAAIKMELGGTGDESVLKSQRLVDDVISWFAQPQSGKLILKCMISYFDVDAFDGTHEMIAVEIMDMHDQLLEAKRLPPWHHLLSPSSSTVVSRHRSPPLCRSFRPLASRRRSPPRRRGVAASLSLKLGLILFVHRQGVVLFVHRRGVVLLLCRSFHPPSRHRSPLRCRGVAASLCLSLIVGLGGATRKRDRKEAYEVVVEGGRLIMCARLMCNMDYKLYLLYCIRKILQSF